MPRRRPTRRPRRRLRNKKRRPRRNYISRVPIANTAVVKMPYTQQISLNPGIGTTTYNVFRANSIFDPDYSGTGHQPRSRDEYASLYENYTVLGAKVKATFIPNGYNYVVGVGLNNAVATTPPSTSANAAEDPQYTTRILNYAADSNMTITKTYSAKRFHGVKNIMDDGNQKASMGSNPANDPAFVILCGPADNASDNPALICYVEISYIVKLTDRIQLVQS